MKIDFSKARVYVSARKEKGKSVTADIRSLVADTLYAHAAGALACKVSMKIIDAEGAVDYTPQEIETVRAWVTKFYEEGKYFSPCQYDAVMALLGGGARQTV